MNRTPSAPRPLASALTGALAIAAAAALAACASAPQASAPATDAPAPAAAPTAAPAAALAPPPLQLPPVSAGQWADLGAWRAPWLAGDAPVPVDGVQAPTRVAGLRHAGDGRWLAIIVVQHAPGGQAPCPRPSALNLDGAQSDPCLRMRRNADFDKWLMQQHAVLYHWLAGQGWDMQPRAWVAYRTHSGGGTLEAHALLHPALLEPITRNNHDFLSSGLPGDDWARRFAQAVRAAGSAAPLAVPPLPFATPILPPKPPASAPAAPAPAQAEQLPPAPPRPAPPPPKPDRQ